MSNIGELQVSYTARGLVRYQVRVEHQSLHKVQEIKGDNQAIVLQKAYAVAARWDEMWEARQETERKRKERATAAKDVEAKNQLAAERTREAQELHEFLNRTLENTLSIDDTIDWDGLIDDSEYPEPDPQRPANPPPPGAPEAPREPQADEPCFQPKLGLIDHLARGKRARKETAAREAFETAHREWESTISDQKQKHSEAIERHKRALREAGQKHEEARRHWQAEREKYKKAQGERNAEVETKRQSYAAGDPDSIMDYCGMVLDNSSYPDFLPQSYDLEYNPENRILILDYRLPSPQDLPTLVEVRYVKSKDEFTEKHLSDSKLNHLYDDLLYQIALRTIHELFEADVIRAIDSIVFNGYVESIDAATGQETNACVLTVQASREEFDGINLAAVQPRACFRKLKGVSSARLHNLAAVAPILALSREDRRFVPSHAVVDAIAEGDNLAAMDWEDFEHLIRELFEKEYSVVGGEVKVTRASRDGGVDAVIFDPDPLRGGKTVVQAKRYTNTVGVSAVRDLYGTVLNEGANKGILVTTSDYGPDAYAFAKGKPLVLLSGGNLLHLLAEHGHKARIDLQEAKRLAAEKQQAEH
ncbi:MAG: restriction endonuclease [Candidatus Eisenbacteria bacterium]